MRSKRLDKRITSLKKLIFILQNKKLYPKRTKLFFCFLVVVSAVVETSLFLCSSAIGAANGLVLKAFLFVERLLAFGEDELFSAVLAYQCLVSHSEFTSL